MYSLQQTVSRRLRPENHLYGFAVWAAFTAYQQFGDVVNEVREEGHSLGYDPAAPQCLFTAFSYDRALLPSDEHQYAVTVVLDHTAEFYDQKCELVVSEASDSTFETIISVTTYSVNLGQMLQILPRLKSFGAEILPCLASEKHNEYYISKETQKTAA
jgi:hypothetical protein